MRTPTMPRFLLALTVTLTALTFAVALTARAWGETQPPHPALRGFVEGCEDVPQPCWYGIVPGESTIEDVNSIARRERWTRLTSEENEVISGRVVFLIPSLPESCQVEFDHGRDPETTAINSILFTTCQLRFGDTLEIFPGVSGLVPRIGLMLLAFDPKQVVLAPGTVMVNFIGNLTPFGEVNLYLDDDEIAPQESLAPWEGFKLWLHYCREYRLKSDCMRSQ